MVIPLCGEADGARPRLLASICHRPRSAKETETTQAQCCVLRACPCLLGSGSSPRVCSCLLRCYKLLCEDVCSGGFPSVSSFSGVGPITKEELLTERHAQQGSKQASRQASTEVRVTAPCHGCLLAPASRMQKTRSKGSGADSSCCPLFVMQVAPS